MKILRTLLIIFFLSIPIHSFADQQLSVTTVPEFPSSYEPVRINLSSYSFDVANSLITWNVDGKQFIKGVGIKSIDLNTRGVGDNIPVTVKIVAPNGDIVNSSISINPANIDIVWESQESYVPPFYEGKALPSEGAKIKVTAIPNISDGSKVISPVNLSYSWYVNDDYKDDLSGQGKQSANISLDYLRNKTSVKVKVRSVGGNVIEKTIEITPHPILPILYNYDDILGVDLTHPLLKRVEITHDIYLSLVPYYISNMGLLAGSDSYSWSLDSLPFTPQENTLVRLEPKENSYNTKSLSVIIDNSKRLLQKAQADLTIVFDTRK